MFINLQYAITQNERAMLWWILMLIYGQNINIKLVNVNTENDLIER